MSQSNTNITLKSGAQYRIKGFRENSQDPQILSRLREMGLRNSLVLTFEGQAPFEGPILLRFGSTVLGLRWTEFSCLDLESL
jgi:ferrous iron transport protein A